MDPKELEEMTGETGDAELDQAGKAPAPELLPIVEEGKEVVAEKTEPEKPVPELTAEKQEKVDEAHDQYEKTGTWPEDTPVWVQKAVNRATKQKYAEKTRADTLARENKELRKQLAAKPEPATAVSEEKPEPSLDDFETERDYFLALTNWQIDQREKAAKKPEPAKAGEAKPAIPQTDVDFDVRRGKTMESGKAKYKDFAEAIGEVPGELFNRDVVDAMTLTENPAEVAYYLAKNLPEAERIATMPDRQRAVALGELSARLSGPIEKRTTKAPEPITPVTGSRVNSGLVGDDDMAALERICAKA